MDFWGKHPGHPTAKALKIVIYLLPRKIYQQQHYPAWLIRTTNTTAAHLHMLLELACVAHHPPMHPLHACKIITNTWPLPIPYSCAIFLGSLLLTVACIFMPFTCKLVKSSFNVNIKAHNTPLKQFKFPTIKNLVVYILYILIIILFINDFDLKTRSEMFLNYE